MYVCILHGCYLRNLIGGIKYGIIVKISSWVEPEVKLHLSTYTPSIPTSSDINVRLQSIWLIQCSSEKLDIDFIMIPWKIFIVRELPLHKFVRCKVLRYCKNLTHVSRKIIKVEIEKRKMGLIKLSQLYKFRNLIA